MFSLEAPLVIVLVRPDNSSGKSHLLVLSVTGPVQLGMRSGLCFGGLATVGLGTPPATLPLSLTSAAAADWAMVRMLFPRRAGDWTSLTLLERLGDPVWMEASWLLRSLSGSWTFRSATSGGGRLAKVQ